MYCASGAALADYVGWKQRKEVAEKLKLIYTAATEEGCEHDSPSLA